MITLNGTPREVDAGTLADLLAAEGIDARRGVAVAVDGEVVRRTEWERTPLAEGARVEVVHAVQGG